MVLLEVSESEDSESNNGHRKADEHDERGERKPPSGESDNWSGLASLASASNTARQLAVDADPAKLDEHSRENRDGKCDPRNTKKPKVFWDWLRE